MWVCSSRFKVTTVGKKRNCGLCGQWLSLSTKSYSVRKVAVQNITLEVAFTERSGGNWKSKSETNICCLAKLKSSPYENRTWKPTLNRGRESSV